MIKFIITGYTRSGTTFLASILNSQKKSFCFEFNPLSFKNLSSQEEEDYFNSRLEAIFINLGMEGPFLRGIRDFKLQENKFIEFFHKKHSTLNAGFKKTLLNKNDINILINRGYKIILLKRNIEDTFNSNIRRMDLNKSRLALNYRSYLENIDYYQLNYPKDKLLPVNFESLQNNRNLILSEISNFLGFDVVYYEKRYHSFNKDRFTFFSNSSYKDGKKENSDKNQNKRFVNFINGEFDYKLSTIHYLKKLKGKLLN